ncbi:sulfotransferase [Paucihalobacter ruber]|uniref:Sulfotransferase n=1 Tax=Paucihalobacter ruber TaxID=2567861 RepID=A0A506PM69_9FLAO|nr:sulfotransferase domain-containing protein [Paucihalobacter ruber]TPV34956.1 sulfotransferase [Paucihalobacter ruber]
MTKEKTLPDFLIVGAAKAGTTSLFYYLEEHPEIFLPKIKEPKYFMSKILNLPQNGKGDDLTHELMIKSQTDYFRLFSSKSSTQICGEASVDYLYYSRDVIPLIKENIGLPKIIIVLRDPTIRAFSAYKHLIRDVRENETFEEGLKLEDHRIKSNYEFIWHYKKAGLYYENVKDYIEAFPNVKVIIFEEFINNTQNTLKELYSFLGVDSEFTPLLKKKYNVTGKPKSKALQKLLKGSPNIWLRKVLKKTFNEKTRSFMREKLEGFNISNYNQVMEKHTKQMLIDYYKDDKKKLEQLLEIKLKNWS